MMLNSKTAIKNIQLLKLLAQLRDHIDMHGIIALNVAELQESQISVPCWDISKSLRRNRSRSTSSRFSRHRHETT